ncbi:MAG TPA: peptidylprolyl isomerase [Candidatus Cloacimonadota bacterium]|nr:peptidylprolyl isomerase [Candidatus Cloacimonadota bacterium]
MRIIATVYDTDITESDVLRECSSFVVGDKAPDHLLRITSLAKLIDRALLFNEAVSKGFIATDEEYDALLMDVLEKEFGDQKIDDHHDKAARGLDKLLRCRIILKKYLSTVFKEKIKITDEQLRKYYLEQKEIFIHGPEVRASHLLIAGTGEDSLARCREVLAQIKSPGDFIKLSAEYSECPSNCNCGDLGWFPRGRLLKEIEDKAFELEIDQISEPFLTRHGYHLLMVTGKRESRQIEFEEMKELLRSRLTQIEMEYTLVKLVKKLRDQCGDAIQILDEEYSY